MKFDIEIIYDELICKFINGYVGYNENMDIYVNWKMRFKVYSDDNFVVLKGSVMGYFVYLEDIEKIVFGNYDVFEKIFIDDCKVLRKIEEVVNKIKKIKFIVKSLNNGNKGEFLSY